MVHPELRLIAEREGAVPGEVAPVEVLHAALLATKASGQPDWPTRLSAARAVAALPPEEDEPEPAHQPTTPSIVVYDLPPGTYPVVHRAASGGDQPVSAADAPPAKQPPESDDYMFYYVQPDGKQELIGSWSPPRLDQSADGFVKARIVLTADPAKGEHWRAELTAGRFPIDIENENKP